MKILHCITGLGVGGAESMLYNYLAYEYKNNSSHRHTVAYFYHGPFVQKIEALGIATYQIKGLLCTYDPLFYFRLKNYIKQQSPDIIHAALWSANIFCRIIGSQLKIPVICDLHGDVAYHGWIRNSIEKLTAHMPTQFIAVSDSVKESFDTHILNNTISGQVVTIENGIDTENFIHNLIPASTIRTTFGFTSDDFIIGTVGRHVAIKNHFLLIQAFALFIQNFDKKRQTNIKLCLIGDGPERKNLESLAQKLGVFSKVHFLGMQTDASKMYNLFDLFVLCSKSEGLSIALLEALTAKIPTICTAPTKGHDILTHEVDGLLLPYQTNAQELARAMRRLYTDHELVKTVTTGMHALQNRITLHTTIDKYKNIYATLASQKS